MDEKKTAILAEIPRLRRYARANDLALREVAGQLVNGTLTLLPEA